MKQIAFTLTLFLAFAVSGQSIKLKDHFDSKGKSKLSFKEGSLTGFIKADLNTLELTVVNNGRKPVVIDPSETTLLDISHRGSALCGEVTTIAPGKKAKFELVPCDGEKLNKGLFDLRYSYPSATAFEEGAFFIRNKKFTLHMGGEQIVFYTDL